MLSGYELLKTRNRNYLQKSLFLPFTPEPGSFFALTLSPKDNTSNQQIACSASSLSCCAAQAACLLAPFLLRRSYTPQSTDVLLFWYPTAVAITSPAATVTVELKFVVLESSFFAVGNVVATAASFGDNTRKWSKRYMMPHGFTNSNIYWTSPISMYRLPRTSSASMGALTVMSLLLEVS